MTDKNRKIFADVYRFYESIETPKRSEEFWIDAADRMALILAENGNSDLCRGLLVVCYDDAARKLEEE